MPNNREVEEKFLCLREAVRNPLTRGKYEQTVNKTILLLTIFDL
jgi:hypothetical protein